MMHIQNCGFGAERHRYKPFEGLSVPFTISLKRVELCVQNTRFDALVEYAFDRPL